LTCRLISLEELASSSVAAASWVASRLALLERLASASLRWRMASRVAAEDRVPSCAELAAPWTPRIMALRSASSRSMVSRITSRRVAGGAAAEDSGAAGGTSTLGKALSGIGVWRAIKRSRRSLNIRESWKGGKARPGIGSWGDE
jgi:hypothetical protein